MSSASGKFLGMPCCHDAPGWCDDMALIDGKGLLKMSDRRELIPFTYMADNTEGLLGNGSVVTFSLERKDGAISAGVLGPDNIKKKVPHQAWINSLESYQGLSVRREAHDEFVLNPRAYLSPGELKGDFLPANVYQLLRDRYGAEVD